MNPFLTLGLALRALARNRVRTVLTMLGIMIGIASVIATVATGQGASSMIERQISSMGRNLLLVLPGAAASGGFSFGAGSVTTLTPEDAAAMAREVPSVDAVAPIVRTRSQLVRGSANWIPTGILGTTPAFLSVRDWDLDEGIFFSDADVLSAARTCVLGRTVAENLFLGEAAAGQEIRIKNMPFRVAGVLSRKGTNVMGLDQDDVVLAPWTTVKHVLQGSAFNNVDQLLVTVRSPALMAEAVDDVTTLLRERHRIHPGEESDFRVLPMSEMMAAMTQTSRVMGVLLSLIASISLLVGGIGIMNIMLVSVAERTREIGLRMAVGARRQDILVQFLLEAMVLAAVAGAVGMLLGTGASAVISRTLRWPTLVSTASIGVSFVFSCAVGIFFGFYPALRASRLNPVEALRYE